MNLSKEIKSLRGETFKKAIFITEELDALPTKENGEPDMSGVDNETVENVILNCLSLYQATSTKEGFYMNSIANLILTKEKDTIELKDKLKKFLVTVLEKSILQKDEDASKEQCKKVQKGVYSAWIISQVTNELGGTLDDKDEIVFN